jgi:large subunit ribosomal protein LP0
MPLSKDKKKEYFERMTAMLNTYGKVFVVKVDNVGSQQMNQTRRSLRGLGEILMGKNTLMRKVMKDFLAANPDHFYEKIVHKMMGNVGFVFTNADLPKIRDLILANRVPAPARIGAISPVDVVINAGPTGCDPGQTNFFQVLQIPTKIVKGQIEITNLVNLIKTGEKVGSSEAALLTKLNIKPFSYGLVIDCVFDHGSIFSVDVLDIDETFLASRFRDACSKIAALSLTLGYPTQASLPHSIAGAFKALIAVTINLDNYTFDKAESYKKFLANPAAFAAPAAAAAGGAAAPAAAAVAEKPAEEEVDALDGGMDMFGGGGGGGGDY